MTSALTSWTKRTLLERFAKPSRTRTRLLALLPVLGLSVAASGCVAPGHYGVRPYYGVSSYYGDPYYARGASYGVSSYYSPRRTVVVQPRHVVVKRPKVHVQRVVTPVHRNHRPAIRHPGSRYDPKPAVRRNTHNRVQERYLDRRSEQRREVRNQDRNRNPERARGDDRSRGHEQVRARDRDRSGDRDRQRDGRRRN